MSRKPLNAMSGGDVVQLQQELREALDRQAATQEILDVIRTSPRSTQPVFDAIVNAGLKLFPEATISIALQDGDEVRVAAIAGPDPAGVDAWRGRFPAPLHPETIHGFVILKGKTVDLPDVAAAQDQFSAGARNFLASGYRAVTMIPVYQDGKPGGALSVLRRETGGLSPEQFSMLGTFAGQANIAIENMQLVNEMRNANKVLEDVSSQLAKYIPPQLYQSIMAGERRVAIESRRKKLTIFFSDIVGFTEITDQLEAEELTSLLNEYLTEMSNIAEAHGAYFDKFIGDGMMFYFGDPVTKGTQGDAAACVRMAVSMQERLSELQAAWREQGLIDVPFQARMGINTGYCTVGNFGSENRMDFTIIGGEVNLAARLEETAESGGIRISAETYSLVREWVEAEEQDPVTVQGYAQPVRTYSVKGIKVPISKSARPVSETSDGYALTIDPDRLSDGSKARLIRLLETILSELDR